MLIRTVLMLSCLGIWSSATRAAEVTPQTTKKVVAEVGKHDWLLKHPTIQALLARTNQHRGQMGRGPVRLNTEMCLAAQRHANWMASTGAYQHSGLPYMEVIFNGPTSAESAVQGWIASPAHHGILLSGTEVGFGYMVRNGVPYWVGVFR